MAVDWPTTAGLVLVLCAVGAGASILALWLRPAAPADGATRRMASGSRRWVRAVTAAQLAVVVPLLYMMGLTAFGFQRLAARDLGTRTTDILSAEVPLWRGEATIAEAARHVARLQPLLERVAAMPGVLQVAMASDRLGHLPTAGTISVRLPDRPEFERVVAQQAVVSGAYFRLLDIKMVAGTPFPDRIVGHTNWQDIYGGVIVDTTLAMMLAGTEDVVGRKVIIGFSPTTIIGVAAPVKARRPDEADQPRVYLRLSPNAALATNLLVRFSGSSAAMSQAVSDIVQQEMSTDGPVATVLLADELRRLQRPYRGMFELALTLAVVAGVFSLLGLIAAATYVLTRRRKEVAIRLAVGASSADIIRLCIRDVAWAMPLGVVTGLLAGVLLGRQLEGRLFAVSALDPLTLAASTVLMAGLVFAGFAVPSSRRVRGNLIDDLRTD